MQPEEIGCKRDSRGSSGNEKKSCTNHTTKAPLNPTTLLVGCHKTRCVFNYKSCTNHCEFNHMVSILSIDFLASEIETRATTRRLSLPMGSSLKKQKKQNWKTALQTPLPHVYCHFAFDKHSNTATAGTMCIRQPLCTIRHNAVCCAIWMLVNRKTVEKLLQHTRL